MRKSVPLLVAAVSAATLPLFSHTAQAVEYVTVDATTVESGGVSGYSGATTPRQPGGDALLYSIGGGEREDHACYIEFGWWRYTAQKQEKPVTNWWESPCANEHHSYLSTQLIGTASPPPLGLAYGISEIQVCNSGTRLKGVKITKMRRIGLGEPQSEVAATAEKPPPFDRANCNEHWRSASHCQNGKVAVGVNIHHDDDSVTGLELLCATAQAKSTAPPTLPLYSLDASTVHQTDISGFKGTPARIGAPIEKGFALYGLRSLERRDQACYLESTSDLLRVPLTYGGTGPHDQFQTESGDRCGGGKPGDEVKAEAWPSTGYLQEHQNVPYQTLVRSVRICMNNDNTRLKGIEVLGRSVGADLSGAFRVEDAPLNPDKDGSDPKDQRAHCDNWQRWVGCSAGEVATAVVAHFEAGDPPRTVTGLALECAQVKPQP